MKQDIETFLHDKPVLLLLDNFEHLLAAAPLLSDLLEACPGVKVLATSRAPLRLRAEQEIPIPPMALPDLTRHESPEQLLQYEAVRLFTLRAQAVQPGFQARLVQRTRLLPKSATTLMACHWPSSWPQRGSSCCRHTAC